MAVKGELQDVSLATLIQMICFDQHKTALFLKRGTEDGMIFFASGEIIHARLGDIVGTDAVYQLLKWTDGTFQMLAKENAPKRTIIQSWNYLLLEGMKRIDEESNASSSTEKDIESVVNDVVENDNMGNCLIILLSGLEQMLHKLEHKKSIKRPALALGILTKIVNFVVAFSEKQLNEANNDSLAKVLAKAGETYPRICLLQAEHNRLSEKTLLNMYNGWAADTSGRVQTFRQITLGMVDVLRTYFWLFNSCFQSPSLAEQHKELCDIFLVCVVKAVERVEY